MIAGTLFIYTEDLTMQPTKHTAAAPRGYTTGWDRHGTCRVSLGSRLRYSDLIVEEHEVHEVTLYSAKDGSGLHVSERVDGKIRCANLTKAQHDNMRYFHVAVNLVEGGYGQALVYARNEREALALVRCDKRANHILGTTVYEVDPKFARPLAHIEI